MDGSYQKVSPAAAKDILSNQGFLIDVRSRQEYDNGHLPNSLPLPLERVFEDCARVIPNKNVPVILYCTTGTRSRMAAMFLLDLGYKKVYDMGRMSAWK